MHMIEQRQPTVAPSQGKVGHVATVPGDGGGDGVGVEDEVARTGAVLHERRLA